MQTIIDLVLNSLNPAGEHTRISLNTKSIFIDITATDLTKVQLDLDTYHLSIIVRVLYCAKQVPMDIARGGETWLTVKQLGSSLIDLLHNKSICLSFSMTGLDLALNLDLKTGPPSV